MGANFSILLASTTNKQTNADRNKKVADRNKKYVNVAVVTLSESSCKYLLDISRRPFCANTILVVFGVLYIYIINIHMDVSVP